ncbi:phosphohydrolase [Intrasporangium chromatireducens Q5-1]|uniref:Phosphohydrolase n=1 Tax=Intrasporangium chromatireducens Q5-1 TaxID=584657 RepID=W9GSF4_9MICO|nr:HD domain-containing protein [Intrasporangium chromatireducens]EWT06829.1 phosphohydrolase [Intrasporangium chromatireducens Q5-1]
MPRTDLAAAAELARSHLARVEPRWTHVQAVGRTMERLCAQHDLPRELAAAGWLHDIGYAPDLVDSGFHPLDGARFLQGIGESELVTSLVAYHSGAKFEAEERGLHSELAGFDEPPQDALDVLNLVDMTTGPEGARVPVDERLSEILSRYGATDPVGRALARSSDQLRASVMRAAGWLNYPM